MRAGCSAVEYYKSVQMEDRSMEAKAKAEAAVAAAAAAAVEEQEQRGRTLITYSNSLIVRFCLYGFLKNLKFFEPFLVIVLVKWGLSLTTIGLLISVEKITTYAFELPSGYLSDRCGARTTLCSCFIFYIISFICYYFGQVHLSVLVLASFFYGLAEAMRSGAHKSVSHEHIIALSIVLLAFSTI